jgi:hypothetical protein
MRVDFKSQFIIKHILVVLLFNNKKTDCFERLLFKIKTPKLL